MNLADAAIALVAVQRLCELAWSRRNAGRLLAQGGVEHGAGHYPVLILVHVAWLAGLWLFARDRPVDTAWLSVYALLQAARFWVLASLGPRWTTRVIVLPGASPVCSGPYRFMRHPNYAVLAAEVAVLPLVFGLWLYALAFSVLNAAILAVRIKVENRALSASG